MTKLRYTREAVVLIKDYLYALETRSQQFDWEECCTIAGRISQLADELNEVLGSENIPQGSLIV